MLLATVVPFDGPSVRLAPVALIWLPLPLAWSPICAADVAVAIAVAARGLPPKPIVAPAWARAPIVVAAAARCAPLPR